MLFFFVCAILIFVAIKTDVERIKLDTATDFSSRVQHLETTISHLENLATILSQSMTYTVAFQYPNEDWDVINSFEQNSELLALKFIDENYRSGVYSLPPQTAEQRERLKLLVKMGAYLPHFLYQEKIEKIAVYNHNPKATLVYPNNGNASQIEFQKQLNDHYWPYFWENHQNQNIFWKLIKVEDDYKLSLTVSILDSETGLVGLIQVLFTHDVFDQEIYQPSGPDSLVFLAETSTPSLLIATTEYDINEHSISKAFNMMEGEELPPEIMHLLNSTDDWVYQSDDYFLLSVPISGVFNLVYLTDASGFSLWSSSLVSFSAVVLLFLVVLGVAVDRMVYHNLTILKKQDDTLSDKNQLLTDTLKELEKTQQELIQKEKIASLGDVVAGLAHQLNTPLSIVNTAISYIRESQQLLLGKLETGLKKTELEEALTKGSISSELISNNIEKATALVEHFKLLADSGAEDDIIEFNVVEYTQAVLSGLKPSLEKRKIKFSIHAQQEIRIYNFAFSYTQIIVQLVNNAITHGVSHGGNITINIYRKEHSKGVYVDIEDDGKGIRREDIEKIFEPFFTSKCIAEQMGLGLTIVHNLVLGKMSGEINVSSELDQGCRFTLYFPNLNVEASVNVD